MYTKQVSKDQIARWEFTGKLITRSPLHIGDGSSHRKLSERRKFQPKKDEPDPEYATVFTDATGKPVIPATSLKGALRAWATEQGLDEGLVNQVFGTQESGGLVTFHDAPFLCDSEPVEPHARDWDQSRRTCVSPHAVIDPRTGSAREGLLYSVEYVPAGAEFGLRVTGQGTTEAQRGLVVFALRNAFNSDARPARLGSETADGWARSCRGSEEVKTVDIRAWLSGPVRSWREGLAKVEGDDLTQWLSASALFEAKPAATLARFTVTLRFDGRMLVNDPTRRGTPTASGKGQVSHAAVRRENGEYYLPASSVRAFSVPTLEGFG